MHRGRTKKPTNRQTEIQDKTSEDHILEIGKLKIKHDKYGKQATQYEKELFELGDKLRKTTNEKEVLQRELNEAKKLFQLNRHQAGGTQPSKNICNQVKRLHPEKIAGNKFECAIVEIASKKELTCT